MKVIYLLGTDGAGKTSIARKLAAEDFGGVKLKYAYCQLTPILLFPLKVVARVMFLKSADRFQNYQHYRGLKASAGRRHRCLNWVYCLVWQIDQAWQAWLKLRPAWLRNQPVIVDRYYLDAVVETGILLGSDAKGMLRSAQRIEHFLPKADVCLFLNVSEEVAFSRKDDIPSAEYLRERKARYLALAGAYDFHEVNADAPLEEVLSEARKVISPFLNATARVANLARGI